MIPSRIGVLLVLSAPSGTGKTTLCHRLIEEGGMAFSVSCTTRPPREGERDGIDYHFVSPEDFLARVQRGEFLEYAKVHGHHYGTLKAPVLDAIRQGIDILLDLDVQGAAQIRAVPDPEILAARVDVFVLPPDLGELERRLRGRGTETDAQVAMRLANAAKEIPHAPDFEFVVPSGSKEADFEKVMSIVRAERCRTTRLRFPKDWPGSSS